MKEKKRLEIVWETHEITTISFNQNRRATIFCQSCRSDAPHLSVAEAAALLQTTTREIYRQIESGEMHFIEMLEIKILVCGRFLLAVELQPTIKEK